MDIKLLSVDIETTCLLPSEGQILSVGLVDYDSGAGAYWKIEHPIYNMTPEAMRINGIDITSWDGELPHEASAGIRAFLERNFNNMIIVPLGLNVGSFDMLWLKEHMPIAVETIGYRCLDVNSLIAAEAIKTNTSFNHLQKQYTTAAIQMMGDAELVSDNIGPHNALFDAYMNCAMLSMLQGSKLPWLI